MNRQKRSLCSITLFLFLLIALVIGEAAAQLPWPVEPTNADHPIGNVFGEFQQYASTPYLHTGHDVLEHPAPNGPWVISVTGGALTLQDDLIDPTDLYNGVTIITGTTTYRYWHLDHNTIQQDVRNAVTKNIPFPANTRISRIVNWPDGKFHHLHFDISRGGNFINPFSDGLAPEADNILPQVHEILICRNNSNTFLAKPATGSWIVDGDLDIIARVSDRDPPLPAIAWQGNIGIYRIEYSITELAGTGTHNVPATQLYRFDTFSTTGDGSTEAAIIYKDVSPADSESNYSVMNGEQYYYIVTNVDSSGNLSEANGCWDTDGGNFPDGLYQISVTAYDFVGNQHTRSETVLVDNIPVDLWISDGINDIGYNSYDYNSNDIWSSLSAIGTSHENPVSGLTNYVHVRVHNLSSSAAYNVDVTLYWANTSTALAWPADFHQIGTIFTISSIPAGGDAEHTWSWYVDPAFGIGHHFCFVATADCLDDPMTGGPIGYTYVAPYDNNIAQKNITIVEMQPGQSAHVSFLIENNLPERIPFDLVIKREGFPVGQLILFLPDDLMDIIQKKDDILDGLRIVEGKEQGKHGLLVTVKKQAAIRGIELEPMDTREVSLEIIAPEKAKIGEEFTIRIEEVANKEVIGANTFLVRIVPPGDCRSTMKQAAEVYAQIALKYQSEYALKLIEMTRNVLQREICSDRNRALKWKRMIFELEKEMGNELKGKVSKKVMEVYFKELELLDNALKNGDFEKVMITQGKVVKVLAELVSERQ
ncbi:MAG: hypothetical protein KAV87_31790 [Desulfobacteraceae bacterium]|nr:hypothetical protein [Desulfobacteraceae bacterium]